MMRINLLPPEILERRQAEKRVGWVVIGGVSVAAVLAIVWGYGYLNLQSKRSELASVQQQTQTVTAQANQLAIFEERATELEARRQTVALALAERRNWGRLFDELSLVMPSDIWLQTLQAAEADGLQLGGYAIDAKADSPDLGHKTMAKTLIRLADLEQLRDVWLESSTKAEYAEQPVIQFSLSADVLANEGGTP